MRGLTPLINIPKIRKEVMKMSIFAKDMELTEALENTIHEQFGKLDALDDFIGESNLDVKIRVNKQNHVCEALIRVKQKEYFVKSVSQNMYGSIEECAADLKRQIRKSKEKVKTKNRHVEYFDAEEE